MAYAKPGSLLQVLENHYINLYKPNDPFRKYYEYARVGNMAIMLVLELVTWTKRTREFDSCEASYKVLTPVGVGHIIALPDTDRMYHYSPINISQDQNS